MKITLPNKHRWIAQMVAVVALSLSLLPPGGLQTLAQSSVEKSKTTQQSNQADDELVAARTAVAKPNDKPQTPDTGRMAGNYAVRSSIELGYRWVDVNGDVNRFTSDVNVREGFRVLDFSFDARSIDGNGALFDFLRADVSSAGGDQTQYYSLRMDKTRYYKFDGRMRRFYYNRSLAGIANNQHTYDIRQQVSDFTLKLFPQRAVKINLGFGRSLGKGPFVTTYNTNGDQSPEIGNARWAANDYRLGADAALKSWSFFGEYLFRGFRNDSEQFQKVARNVGNDVSNTAVLTLFDRDTPIRSSSHVIRGSVTGSIANRIHVLLQGMHNDEKAKINQYEVIAGTDTSNRSVSRLILATAEAKRPSTSADASLAVDLAENVTLSNTSRYYKYRILGDLNLSTNTTTRTVAGVVTNTLVPTLFRQTTDVTSYWNTLQLQFGRGRKFSGNLGWRYTFRNVQIIGAVATDKETERQNTNTFIGGARFRPSVRTDFFIDYENGSSDNVFVRINPIDYQRVRVRANIGVRDTLSLHTTFTATDRTNPTPQVKNDSDYRDFSVSVMWEPKARFWIDGGYNYDYIFSTANIAFFVSSVLKTGTSRYYSRQHFFFFDTRIGVTKRLDLFVLYRYLKDVGAPNAAAPVLVPANNDFVTSLPLQRHNPEARLAFRCNNHVTANLSYRHYSYNERFNIGYFQSYTSTSTGVVVNNIPDYRANIVTASMRFTF
ncbi:MAG: hypothetical protein HY231_01035 [Acidobacteria bacterium]|nr:hypothetical protein [Acidobacteriota bacterium]